MPSQADTFKSIADGTIDTVQRGVVEDRRNQQLINITPHLEAMMGGTTVYWPNNRHLAAWRTAPSRHPERNRRPVEIQLAKMTTLGGCRYIQTRPDTTSATVIGVLNFASATQPGGGFRNGASAQEESLARSSSLFQSLESTAARDFYDQHTRRKPFYSHTMIYSPSVVILRDDRGDWVPPTVIDVLTCAAVNAKDARRAYLSSFGPRLEQQIEATMKERMGRLLELFEHRKATDLVLGSFGTGVFQNDVWTIAEIWRELLFDKGARFRFSFHSVVFAIPDSRTLAVFDKAFTSSRGHGCGLF